MQIQLGTYYVNKTWKYLLPCLSEYGSTFKAKYNALFKLASGIHDVSLDGTKYHGQRLIYVLIDRLYRPAVTTNILQWMEYQPYIIKSYPFDDVITGRKQMLVIRVPDIYNESYDQFVKGSYSMMYNNNQIQVLFPDPTSEARAVLMRTDPAYDKFIANVEASFGTKLTKKDLIGAELDFPLEKFKEIFNYKTQFLTKY